MIKRILINLYIAVVKKPIIRFRTYRMIRLCSKIERSSIPWDAPLN